MVLTDLLKIFTEHANSQPLAFVIALAISFLITPIVRERAIKLGLVDLGNKQDSNRKEGDRKKIHKRAVPRLGGIAILVSLVITSAVFFAMFGKYTPTGIKHLALEGMAIGGFIIFFVGLLDDIQPLGALVKLAGQITASTVAWSLGVQVKVLANPIYYFDHSYDPTIELNTVSSLLVTVFFLVAISNAINLIDGIDGLAVGVCLIAAMASWAITMSPALNQPAGAILAATMAGACLGFLRYNFNPARIFLGDNGAYLLGFLLGCISCIGLVKKVTVVIISPILILIFAVPIIDTVFAILRRAMKNEHIMKPDLGHLHYKLMDYGFTQKQVSYLLYFVTFICGLLGCFLLGQEIVLDFLVISSVVLFIWLFFTFVINWKKQKWDIIKPRDK